MITMVIILFPSIGAAADDLPPLTLKNSPDGFGGLNWGDSAKKLGDDKILFNEGKSDASQSYTIPGEGIKWDDFEISDVNFFFRYDQLVMVRIYFTDSTDTEQLKKHAMEKYDEPTLTKTDDGGVSYLWRDEVIGVSLQIYPNRLPRVSLINQELAEKLAK
jgi:hypothetical protein